MASSPELDRARGLIDSGRLNEAYAITAPLAAAPHAEHRSLALHASVLKGLRRREEALAVDRRAVARFPDSGVAWHNLAATLGDLGRGPESAEAMAQAFALGLDSLPGRAAYRAALTSWVQEEFVGFRCARNVPPSGSGAKPCAR